MKRLARAKSKTLRLLIAKLEQHDGPITPEFLKLADMVSILLGVERKVKFSSGGHTGRPPDPEDTRSAREKILDDMNPEQRKRWKAIWAAEDRERDERQQQAEQSQQQEAI